MEIKLEPRTAKDYLECIFENLEGIRIADLPSRRRLSAATECCQKLWNLLGFPICPIGDLIRRPRKTSLKK